MRIIRLNLCDIGTRSRRFAARSFRDCHHLDGPTPLKQGRKGAWRSARRGYALLVVLLLLSVAASAMTGMCLRSLKAAAAANDAADALQTRWGRVSCQATVLPQAEELLVASETRLRRPVSSVWASVRLGSERFDILVSDEQAKLNLGALYTWSGPPEAERALSAAAARAGMFWKDLHPPVILLRPSETAPPFESFGEVFKAIEPKILCGNAAQPGLGSDVTLWGDGRLNFRRSSADAADKIIAPVAGSGAAPKLMEARKRDPKLQLSDALDLLQLTREQHDILARRLCDTSGCHSLWIVSRPDDVGVNGASPAVQRAAYSLKVVGRDAAGSQRTFVFYY